MWPIIKKELEERYWLILVGLAVFTLLHIWTYWEVQEWIAMEVPFILISESHGSMRELTHPFYNVQKIHQSFLVLFGAITGFSMFFFEDRRGNWAFLKHRSLDLSLIFSGKCLAGLIIFLVATLPYSLGQLYWCAIPGKMSIPWTYEYLLLILLSLSWGLITLFSMMAATLPGLSTWQRILPVTALFVLSIVILSGDDQIVNHPTLALLIGNSLISSFFLVHTWLYLSHARGGVLTWMSMAFCASFLVTVIVGSSIDEYQTDLKSKQAQSFFYEFKEGQEPRFTLDGRAVQVLDNTHSEKTLLPLLKTELAGNLQLIPKTDSGLLFKPLIKTASTIFFDEVQSVQMLYFDLSSPPSKHYYWLKKDNLVAAYDTSTRKRVGFLGQNGWVTQKSEAQPFNAIQDIHFIGKFSKTLQPWYWIRTQSGTYLWDTSSQDLHFFEGYFFTRFGTHEGHAFAMDHRSYLHFDLVRKSHKQVALPKEMKDYAYFSFHESELGVGFISHQRLLRETSNKSTFLAFIKWDGQVLESGRVHIPFQQEDPIGPDPEILSEAAQKMSFWPGRELYDYLSSFPFNQRVNMETDKSMEQNGIFRRDPSFARGILFRNVILGLTTLLFFTIRRRLNGWNLFQAMLTVVLGYPWFLVIWVFPLFQDRAICPLCKKKRTLATKECDYCKKAWPEPSAVVLSNKSKTCA